MPTTNNRDFWFMNAQVDQDVSSRSGAPEGWTLYFAYDEDMDEKHLRARYPGAVQVGRAHISSSDLCADNAGNPTLKKNGSENPAGVLWAVSPEDMEELERYQASRKFARKEKRVVFKLEPLSKRRRTADTFYGPAVYFTSRRTPFNRDKANLAAFEAIARKCAAMGASHHYLDKVNEIIQLSNGTVECEGLPDKYLEYVCPRCFHQVHECTCSGGSNATLVQIDRGIQHAVQVLNLKGYNTRYSCEGHPTGTYLVFAGGSYLPEAEAPAGFAWDSLVLQSRYDKDASEDELYATKRQRLAALEAWCDALPANRKVPKFVNGSW